MRWLVRILGAPLEIGATPCADGVEERRDAIVALGAPLRHDGSLSPIAEERVRAAVALWAAGGAPLLCMTGGAAPGVRAPRSEAEAMAELARELGVPGEALVVEPRATNTRENALLSARLLLPRGFRRVWVVTQPFHLRRAVYWFRRAGFEARGCRLEGSLQYRCPRLGLRWVAREYGAWARFGWYELRARYRGEG